MRTRANLPLVSLPFLALAGCGGPSTPDGKPVWDDIMELHADGSVLLGRQVLRRADQPWGESRVPGALADIARRMEEEHFNAENESGPLVPGEWLPLSVAEEVCYADFYSLLETIRSRDVLIGKTTFLVHGAEEERDKWLYVREFAAVGTSCVFRDPSVRLTIAAQPSGAVHVLEDVDARTRFELRTIEDVLKHPLVAAKGLPRIACARDVKWRDVIPVLEAQGVFPGCTWLLGDAVWYGPFEIHADGVLYYDGARLREKGDPRGDGAVREKLREIASEMSMGHLDPENASGHLFVQDRLPVLVEMGATFEDLWPLLRMCLSHGVGISRFAFGAAEYPRDEESWVCVDAGPEWLEDVHVNALPASPQPCWTVHMVEGRARHLFELVDGDARIESPDPDALAKEPEVAEQAWWNLRCGPDVPWSELLPVVELLHEFPFSLEVPVPTSCVRDLGGDSEDPK